MKILAVIPARGGSKGIKKKNIVNLLGKPLIAYTIECCLKSKLINRTIVSTDNTAIAKVAKEYKAEVPFFRPKKFALDLSSDFEVFYHALQWLKKNENYMPDIVLHMRAVYPVRSPSIIDKAIRIFIKNPNADSLRAVCYSNETPYKMWKIKGKYLEPLLKPRNLKECYNMPRQALPKVLLQQGYVDVVRPKVILKDKLMSGKKIIPFFCEHSIDIDYPEDLLRAETLLKRRK